jgi:hypothetical protein
MRLLKSPVFWLALLLGGVMIALYYDVAWVRGPAEWQWARYAGVGLETRVWLPLLSLLVALAGLRWLERRPSPHSFLPLLFLFGTALFIQISFIYLESPPLWLTPFLRTVSFASGGFFNVASTTQDIPALLRHFPEAMPHFPAIHPRTHPPGLLFLFWAAERGLAQWPAFTQWFSDLYRPAVCQDASLTTLPNAMLASTIAQMSVPIWAAVTVFPFYGLVRRLANHAVARWATLLLILAPSLVLWATRWNQLYVFLTVTCLYLSQRGLMNRSWRPFLLVGILVSLATFFSLANLALAVLIPLYILLFLLLSPVPWYQELRNRWRQWVAYGLGLASVWGLYYLAYGVSFLEMVQAGTAVHTELNRTYTTWLGYNLYDFFLFLSLPVLVLALASLKTAVKTLPTAKSPETAHSLALLFTFWITLLALNLSGIVRGEVARLWMFLVPLAILAALPALQTWKPQTIQLVILLQAAFLLVLGYSLRPVGPGYIQPHFPAAVLTTPLIPHPVTAELDHDRAIAFSGYKLKADSFRPGETAEITLYWRANEADHSRYPYTAFVHLLTADGLLVAQHDSVPQAGQFPNSCWRPGEVVADTHTFPLPEDLPPGIYRLQAGMYRLDWLLANNPAHRVTVYQGGQVKDVIELGELEIERNEK